MQSFQKYILQLSAAIMMNDQAVKQPKETKNKKHHSTKTNYSLKHNNMKKTATLILLAVFSALQIFAQTYTHYLSRLQGTNRISIQQAAYDKVGNGYVCGWYSGAATVNGNTYNSKDGESDPFVAKVDTLGNWKWFVPITETSSSALAYDVAVDSNFNVYAVGTCDSGATVLGVTQTNGSYGVGTSQLFFIKISQSGNTPTVAWFKGSQATLLAYSNSRGASVVVDKDNNIFVASTHIGSGDVTPSFAGVAYDYSQNSTAFVWKFNAASSVLNKWETSGTNILQVFDMAADKNGNVLFSAAYETYLDSVLLQNNYVIANSAGRTAYYAPIVIKLNNSLDIQWAKAEWTANTQYYAYDLAVDTNGNSFVLATLQDSVQIGNNYFNANAGYLKQAILYSYTANGNFNFIKKYNNTGGDVECNRISCDAQNKMVISADLYSGVPTFEGITISDRSFVARINPANGNVLTIRTTANDNIATTALAVRKNNVLLAGSNYGSNGVLQFNASSLSLPDFSSANELGYAVEFSDSALTTGIEETPSLNVALVAYPNPASSLLNISIGQNDYANLQYSLVDIQGRTILTQPIGNANFIQVDVSGIAAGMYHLVLQGKDGRASKRIIIQ
jgi:hypothetical protein